MGPPPSACTNIFVFTGQVTNRPHVAIGNQDQSGNPLLPILRERMADGDGGISLHDYVECVLYDPEAGYYTRPHSRVGRSDQADFYTAESLGGIYARLVLSAIQSLVNGPLDRFTFVEFGPESEAGLIGQLDGHPFAGTRQIRPGDPVEIPSPAVVFSNELFDAQPFRRYVREAGEWKEAGVILAGDRLDPVLLAPRSLPAALPDDLPDGYTIDWPSGAHALMKQIGSASWNGLFLAFDYGLDRATVFRERPEGTARTYAGHRMGTNLLENPGQCDITCHVIWEELEETLAETGFSGVTLARQEAFFVNQAAAAIAAIVESQGPGFSREKQTLMELLHPQNMGHKFQVLHGHRDGT